MNNNDKWNSDEQCSIVGEFKEYSLEKHHEYV